MRFQMYRNFDDSRALALSRLWHLATPSHLILAWGIIALAAPALACPGGPRPTDPYEPYVAVCAGDAPYHDKFITTRLDGEDGSYLLEAFGGMTNRFGSADSSARVSEARSIDIYLNPDLHASISGEAHSDGNLTGGVEAAAMVSFRDILTIKGLPTGEKFPFEIDFLYHGTLAGSGYYVDHIESASRGWANLAINFSLYNLDEPENRDSYGVAASTLTEDEAPVGSIPGVYEPFYGNILLDYDAIEEGLKLVLEGSIDMVGTARGGDPAGASFKADFFNSVRFAGIHIYTDDTRTTELTGYTIESAFGFDYRLNAVPEPTSITLLAIVGVLFGRPRRQWATAAARR